MKNISVAGGLHSGNFIERSLVQKIVLDLRPSSTSGGLFSQLIDEAPNLCNVLYPTEVNMLYDPSIYLLLIVIFNHRSDPLFLDVSQVC